MHRTLATGTSCLLAHGLLFFGYLLFRGYNPAIRFTEKPMELAFLSSAIVSPRLPPPDPWFAGESINYYVFGYVEMAAIAKSVGIVPEVAFNLALASLFSSAVVAAACVAGQLAARARGSRFSWAAALLAALLLVGVGNWQTAWLLLRDPREALHASWWSGPGWQASRVIVDSGFPWGGSERPTINEFPAFSFVLGDLHPHVLAFPIVAAYVTALAAWIATRTGRAAAVCGVILGLVWITNTWSLPLAGLLALVSLWLCQRDLTPRDLARGLLLFGVAGAIALPFQRSYVPSYGLAIEQLPAPLDRLPLVSWVVRTVGIVLWDRSSFGELWRAHGTLLMPAVAFVVAALLTDASRRPRAGLVVAVTGFFVILALVSRAPAVALFGLPTVALVWLGRRTSVPLTYAMTLLSVAWAAIVAVEFVFLRDAFGDRMNTVFKVYFDAWILQAIGLAVLIVGFQPVQRLASHALWCTAAFAIFLGSLYTPLSVWKWTDGFRHWQGLDGLAYLRQEAGTEYEALMWVRRHAAPDAVVLEAPGCSYGSFGPLPHNRVSMVTGRATVLGWDGHEYQWRRGSARALAELQQRQEELSALFMTPTVDLARTILDRYQVTFVYLGTLERLGLGSNCSIVPAPQADRLESVLGELGWVPVYRNAAVTILARPGAAGRR